MNRNRLKTLLLIITLIAGIFPMNVFSEDSAANNEEFSYFMNTAEGSSYVWLGESIEEKGIEFLDSQRMGITDSADILYNETVLLDGLYARKQYNANSAYFKIGREVYSEGDSEFLVSIVFYDFGPSEGKFYFEYHTKSGATKRVTIVKPGTNPGWAVKTVCVDDLDPSKTYENGATIRIVNGAFNAFKKIELVNVSKAKREKNDIKITNLGIDLHKEMQSLKLIPQNDERFVGNNLSRECTLYDAQTVLNMITTGLQGEVSGALKNKTLTQGELLEMFLTPLNVKRISGESAVDAAKRLKVTDSADFFIFDEAAATNYHLLSIAHAAVIYENNAGENLIAKLLKSGFYEGMDVSKIESDTFQYIYYKEPRELPYKTIVDNTTGRTYHYINFFGNELVKAYLSFNCWLPDNSGFLCSTKSGYMYIYDIENQKFTYLDKCLGGYEPVMTVCANGWVYYFTTVDGVRQLWRIHPKTYEKECVYTPPEGMDMQTMQITADGKYMSMRINDATHMLNPPTDTEIPVVKHIPVVRVNLEDKTLTYQHVGFKNSNLINHIQINPVYPDLVMFCHDATGDYREIYDRVNVVDLSTSNVMHNYQGQLPDGNCMHLASHEIWSKDGEYIYYCNLEAEGIGASIARIDKDGRHRQYITHNLPRSIANHANVSWDNKMICFDGEYVALLSVDTAQTFVITNIANVSGENDPYHPHPNMSYTGNMVAWSHGHDGVLGVAWMDYTDILENEVAKGGHFAFGEDVECISYEDLECESKIVTKSGRECVTAIPGKSIFFDINPEIIDTTNGSVKITFDYFDNSIRPFVLTYTGGVIEPNDIVASFNKKMEVRRSGSGKWKTAEVIIKCGNFENAGKYFSDFKITSTGLSTFISNVRVEALPAGE